MPGRIGTEFAGYRIEALIGRGGTSTVFRAESMRLGLPIALKILNVELAEDEAFRERFVRESRLAARVNHPNVITIYDAGAVDGDLYIAMRYVAGGDLKQRIAGAAEEPMWVISILAQVASGLDAAHAQGLVHRDVKPANIMVDSGPGEEAPEIAYISDFGLIKHVHSSGKPTASGEFLGSIAYVAPEQIEGRPLDARADVYSLGCVAYECLTGEIPFQRDNDAAVLWAHMKEEPPAPSAISEALPVELDRVIARAMAKDPDDRYATCGELVADLRRALMPSEVGRSTLTVPLARLGLGERSPSWRKLGAAGLAGLVIGGLGVWAALALTDDENRTAAAATVTAQGRTVVSTVVTTGPVGPPSWIPDTVRARCKVVAPPTTQFDEAVVCSRPGPGVQVVSYSHASSGPKLSNYFYDRVGLAGLAPPAEGGRLGQFGSCDATPDLPGVEEWNVVGTAGHNPVGRTELGDSDGRVLCYMKGGQAHIEWTRPDPGIWAHAYGKNYGAVFNWWRTAAGPLEG